MTRFDLRIRAYLAQTPVGTGPLSMYVWTVDGYGLECLKKLSKVFLKILKFLK